MVNQAQTSQILSLNQLLMLSREELISKLLEAQGKIQELEGQVSKAILSVEDVSICPTTNPCTGEPMFSYYCENSVDKFDQTFAEKDKELVHELQLKLKRWNFDNTYHQINNDDLIVAYEHIGDFPNCDEDLLLSPESEEHVSVKFHPEIVINDDAWSEEDSEANQFETFPLIPSPVLNTPPYEYIFLTKSNEAKYRIFLNQKLDKVFQEEIKKLQVREEQLMKGQSQYVFHYDENEDESDYPANPEHQCTEQAHADHLDVHNKNHLKNASSAYEINGASSAANVIHCFDPSDVDIELKKIFTENPPITHKIVRRKSRRERGSSVPAVDSYYGTRDLNKVGHASYFIPTLSESERKAIGWKNEYHYGHWKYSTLNVPNPKSNLILLHPRKEVEEASQSKHHYNHHHSGILLKNPLHHHEINLLEPFCAEHVESAINGHQKFCSKHLHYQDQEGKFGSQEDEDPLSFITLSGCSNELSQSCHIIPDKSTLKRILRWILPCIKRGKSTASDIARPSDTTGQAHQESKTRFLDTKGKQRKKSKDKEHHEIETLVEPSGKLNFPASHTYISFVTNGMDDGKHVAILSEDTTEEEKLSQEVGDTINPSREKYQHGRQHSHHHQHHHHHGIFHWKKISSQHGTSDESMSVVGGDVVESAHEKFVEKEVNPTRNMSFGKSSPRDKVSRKSTIYVDIRSSDESETENEANVEPGKSNQILKLKSCKAYIKLLTLKDLGYETEDAEVQGSPAKDCKIQINADAGTTTSVISSSTENVDSSPPQVLETEDEREISNLECTQSKEQQPSRRLRIRPEKGVKEVVSGNYASRTNDVSFTDAKLESCGDDVDSTESLNGYPFSSMSISHQNSVLGTNWAIDSEIIVPSDSQTEHHVDVIETRFLDPKDLIMTQLTDKKTSSENQDEEVLPFVFDYENYYDPNEDAHCGVEPNNVEKVIQWTGENFAIAEDLEEGLGLLSVHLKTVLKKGKLLQEQLQAQDGGQEQADDLQPEDSSPEKVEGKHRIITLNDLDSSIL